MRNVIFTTLLLAGSSFSSLAHDLVVIDNIDTHHVESQISENIETIRLKNNLSKSGLVNSSIDVNSITWEDESNLKIDFSLDVIGESAQFSERMTYTVPVMPYINYSIDAIGIYPKTEGFLTSTYNNPFTRKDINNKIFSELREIMHKSIVESYLSGRNNTSESLSQVEDYLGHMEFYNFQSFSGKNHVGIRIASKD